jgi:hypothetical protein
VVGQNTDYDLLSQIVLTKPNTRYRLSSYVRSDNLSSDAGPRWRVAEVGCSGCNAETSDPAVGTSPWHPLEVEFATRPQTQAVRISFWRPRDQMFGGDITGTVWVDNVTIRAADGSEPDARPARTR